MPHNFDGVSYQRANPRFSGWMTPPDFFEKLNYEFSFTLDAAASYENALLPKYCTPEGKFQKAGSAPGTESVTKLSDADGLNPEAWSGERVFFNPPYDAKLLPEWIKCASSGAATIAVGLLPPNTDTAWFQSLVDRPYDHLMLWKDCTIDFLPGRIKFLRPALQPGRDLADYEKFGDDIFDFEKPPVPGPQPRAGNMLVIWQ